ncbi:uncharacterized protein LOC142069292 [Caretta caretta]|uniref:uncharacterized protein LOC142069292 n=1 Tax=Caretta caretta TaxID=8467 RepID=UPI003F4BEAF4
MPPRAKQTPIWSNGKVLDLISVCGEEAVQSQLCSSHRNYDIYGQRSRAMMERGHDRDTVQCRVKVKELQNAYRKACEANGRSGAVPATCRFYKELDAILGGDTTSTPRTTMDTSQPSATRREEEEEESRSEGAEVGGDTPESLEACSQEFFSSQEEGSQSQLPMLGEGQTQEQVPNTLPSALERKRGQPIGAHRQANVTLDPDTAHPRLVLSKDEKSVRWEHTLQQLPSNPERFDSELCVLGCEGFTSGRHCWEVEVGGRRWAVGVARESVGRKGEIIRSPERGIWAVGWWEGQFWALTSPVTPSAPEPGPQQDPCLSGL